LILYYLKTPFAEQALTAIFHFIYFPSYGRKNFEKVTAFF